MLWTTAIYASLCRELQCWAVIPCLRRVIHKQPLVWPRGYITLPCPVLFTFCTVLPSSRVWHCTGGSVLQNQVSEPEVTCKKVYLLIIFSWISLVINVLLGFFCLFGVFCDLILILLVGFFLRRRKTYLSWILSIQ